MKIAFLCLPGLESVLKDLVPYVAKIYEIKTCYTQDQTKIKETIEWADTVWFNWANELPIFCTNDKTISKLLKKKRVIVRLHSYETLHGYIPQINWEVVDQIIFVAEHVKDHALNQIKPPLPTWQIIPNGVDVKKFNPGKTKQKDSFALLAYLSNKKGIQLLCQTLPIILAKRDSKLYIGGVWQEERFKQYFEHFLNENSEYKEKVIFDGWIKQPEQWLKDKKYIICTSPWEGHPVGIMQGIASGCVPLIHNFPGAKNIFPEKYIWSTLNELEVIIRDNTLPMTTTIRNIITKQKYPLYRHLNHVVEFLGNYKQAPMLDDKFSNLLDENIEQTTVLHEQKTSEVEAITFSDVEIEGLRKKHSLLDENATCACVIPVRNGEKTIKDTLYCLLKQSGNTLNEIVVVNDKSTDSTPKIVGGIISEYEDSPIKIKLVEYPKRCWHYRARKLGVDHVNSRYVFFLDADDIVQKNYCIAMVEALENNTSASFAYCGVSHFEKDISKANHFPAPDFDLNNLLQHNYIPYSSMIRVEAFNSISGYSNYLNYCWNHACERYLWLRLINEFGVPVKVKTTNFYYRVHGEQQSKKHKRSRIDQQFQMFYDLREILEGDTQLKSGVDKLISSVSSERFPRKKILFVAKARDPRNSNLPSFEFYTWLKPLSEFGEVFTFSYDVDIEFYGQSKMNKRLIQFAETVKPDIIFHASYKDDIYLETWRHLSEQYKTYVWNSDDNWKFDRLIDYCQNFTDIITTYPEMKEKWSRYTKQKSHLSQWAANSHYMYDMGLERDIDISFCGQMYGNRKEIMDKLKNDFPELNIQCYGNGWENSMLDYPDMCKIYNRSKVVINFAGGKDGTPQLKLRPFEATACGALCVTEEMPGLEEHFNFTELQERIDIDNDEIIIFNKYDDLKVWVNSMFNHNGLSLKYIPKNGYKRTHKDHLWKNRFKKIFDLTPDKEFNKPIAGELYDKEFFAKRDKYNPALEIIADIMSRYFEPKTAFDFGCGNGYLLKQLKDKSVTVFGFENSKAAEPYLEKNLGVGNFSIVDPSEPGFMSHGKVDLCICMEVAEHLKEDDALSLVSNIANSSTKYVWWTAAQPGQGGVGHINCQSLGYWKEKFEERGFKQDKELTAVIKSEMDKEIFKAYPWFCNNLIIFKNF